LFQNAFWKAVSVPFWRMMRYCSGVKSFRSSASLIGRLHGSPFFGSFFDFSVIENPPCVPQRKSPINNRSIPNSPNLFFILYCSTLKESPMGVLRAKANYDAAE